MAPIVFRPWARKQIPPFQRLRIDWSHPLANGLIGCWVPGVSAGINLVGAGPNLVPINYAGNQTLVTSADGPAWKTGHTGDGLKALAPPAFLTGNNSYYWRGFFNSVAGGNNGTVLMGCQYSDPETSPYISQALTISYGAATFAAEFGTGGNHFEVDAAIPPDVIVVSACATFAAVGSGNARIYTNGLLSSSTSGVGAPNTSATTTLCLVASTASTTRIIDQNCFIGCTWNRELSADEVALMDADPYGFLIPDEVKAPTFFLPSVVTPGAATLLQTRNLPGLGPQSRHVALLNAPLPITPAVVTTAGSTLPMMGVG